MGTGVALFASVANAGNVLSQDPQNSRISFYGGGAWTPGFRSLRGIRRPLRICGDPPRCADPPMYPYGGEVSGRARTGTRRAPQKPHGGGSLQGPVCAIHRALESLYGGPHN
eukprot:1140140-Pelagomonas_calceolata.AAC.3